MKHTNIVSRYADLGFLLMQNIIIVGLVYTFYNGVSRYAVILNLLHLTAVVITAKYFAFYLSSEHRRHIKFAALILFQFTNAILLGSFSVGVIYLGMV
jgi:hypothetical protein